MKITSHTQTNTPATPAHNLLDLVATSSYSPGPSVAKKLSPVPPLILFLFISFLFPFFLFFLLLFIPAALCCIQSQTAGAGQSDVPLKPEEFIVGDSTGEKLIVFPSVQSTPSARHVNLSLPTSSPSRCEFPADFPLKHMLQL